MTTGQFDDNPKFDNIFYDFGVLLNWIGLNLERCTTLKGKCVAFFGGQHTNTHFMWVQLSGLLKDMGYSADQVYKF